MDFISDFLVTFVETAFVVPAVIDNQHVICFCLIVLDCDDMSCFIAHNCLTCVLKTRM